MPSFTRHHHTTPVLAFLDTKPAYDAVDRNVVWTALQPTLQPALLSLLQNTPVYN
ncbi:MAG: hypothetical protein EXX96DRAFT_615772 [Benjaminiella poitrasii]|nr:MAG: hypothetical protein EXX96DRAFT_615772 [Benjaminiella poitrasii]